MAYYYNSAGYKVPVDDHSTPEEKDAAAKQEQNDARAAAGDNSTNGDPNGVQAPGAAGEHDRSGAVVDGPTGNTQGTANNPQARAADAAAAAKAQADAAALADYRGHYQYGGYYNGANDAANRYRQEGEAAQGRAAPQIDYGVANDDHNRNVITSQNQNLMAGLLAARANGTLPSIAGMRANQDISRALADQSSIAAGARGPAALALAQQQQANNSAQAMSGISNSAQINTAQEQLNNTVAAGQAYTGIRQGDQALQSQDAAQATAQGQLNEQQRAANDAFQLGMTGYETGVQGAQLQAQGNQIAGERGAYATQQGIDLAHDQNSTAKTTPYITGALAAGGAITGGIVTGLLGSASGSTTTPNAGVGGGSTTNPSGGSGSAAGASAGDPSGAYNSGSTLGGTPNVADVYGAGSGFMPQSTQMFKAPTQAAIPGEPVMPQTTPSDARAKVPTSLSTMHDDTTGPASPSVSMARMLAAKQQQEEREKKAKEYGGLVAGVVNGLGQAFAQQPQQARITPVVAPQQQITLSDDRTKLAAAWDQGHNAALDKVQQYRTMTPAELKNVAARGDRVAAAVRGAKADAYDEARGVNQSMTSIPTRQPTSFTRGASTVDTALTPDDEKAYQSWKAQYAPNDSGGDYDLRGAYAAGVKPDPQSGHWPDTFKKPNHPTFSDESQYSKQGTPGHWDGDLFIPPPGGQQASLTTTQSDDRTKMSMASMMSGQRRNVGTLGKEVSADDTAEFARSLRSVPYSYKPDYAAREGQQPGEVNVGPVAQEVEKSRIGATIVKPDPAGSGMRTLDQQKMVKGLGSVAAAHQDKLDEHDRTLSLMARRLGGAR